MSKQENKKVFIGPLKYTSQRAENGSRINQYSVGVHLDQVKTKAGTVSSSMTEFTGASHAYLGGEFMWDDMTKENKKGFSAKVFSGESRIAIEKDSDPNGLGVYGRNVSGAQAIWSPYEKLGSISVQALDLRDRKDSIQTAGMIPLQQVQAASVSGNITPSPKFILNSIEFESAVNKSYLEPPAATGIYSEPQSKTGFGYNLKVQGDAQVIPVSYTGSYTERDPDFFYGGDLRKADISLKQSFFQKNLLLSESYTYSTDNLKNQKQSTTTEQRGQAAAEMKFSGFSFSFKDEISEKTNKGNPSQNLLLLGNSFFSSGGYAFGFSIVKVNISSSYAHKNTYDKSDPRVNNDTLSQTLQQNLDMFFDLATWWTLETKAQYVTNKTTVYGLESGELTRSPSGKAESVMKWLKGKLVFRTGYILSVSDSINTVADRISINLLRNQEAYSSLTVQSVKFLDLTLTGKYSENINLSGDIQNLTVVAGKNIHQGGNLTFIFFEQKFRIPLKFDHTETSADQSGDTTHTYALSAGMEIIPTESHTASVSFQHTTFNSIKSPGLDYVQYSVVCKYNARF